MIIEQLGFFKKNNRKAAAQTPPKIFGRKEMLDDYSACERSQGRHS